MVVGERRSFWW
jgi:hypothetical protein